MCFSSTEDMCVTFNALFQIPACDESVNASFHDLGMDVLSSYHHQGSGIRERGTSQRDYENHGTEQRHPLAQLVHQQFNPPADQRWVVGDVIEGWCSHRHTHICPICHHEGMSANYRKQVNMLALIIADVHTQHN